MEWELSMAPSGTHEQAVSPENEQGWKSLEKLLFGLKIPESSGHAGCGQGQHISLVCYEESLGMLNICKAGKCAGICACLCVQCLYVQCLCVQCLQGFVCLVDKEKFLEQLTRQMKWKSLPSGLGFKIQHITDKECGINWEKGKYKLGAYVMNFSQHLKPENEVALWASPPPIYSSHLDGIIWPPGLPKLPTTFLEF